MHGGSPVLRSGCAGVLIRVRNFPCQREYHPPVGTILQGGGMPPNGDSGAWATKLLRRTQRSLAALRNAASSRSRNRAARARSRRSRHRVHPAVVSEVRRNARVWDPFRADPAARCPPRTKRRAPCRNRDTDAKVFLPARHGDRAELTFLPSASGSARQILRISAMHLQRARRLEPLDLFRLHLARRRRDDRHLRG